MYSWSRHVFKTKNSGTFSLTLGLLRCGWVYPWPNSRIPWRTGLWLSKNRELLGLFRSPDVSQSTTTYTFYMLTFRNTYDYHSIFGSWFSSNYNTLILDSEDGFSVRNLSVLPSSTCRLYSFLIPWVVLTQSLSFSSSDYGGTQDPLREVKRRYYIVTWICWTGDFFPPSLTRSFGQRHFVCRDQVFREILV